jgi:cytosine/adenosine deaminase-related metal-dependent hydrolase
MAVRDLLLLDVWPPGAEATDELVRDSQIAPVGERPTEWDGPEIAGRDLLLLPGLVDGHAHVDKSGVTVGGRDA